MATLRVLALAAARRTIGSVVLDGGTLIDWRMSDKAAENADNAIAHLEKLIAEFRPHVVVTEEAATARSKGKRTIRMIEVLADTAEESGLYSVTLPRRQRFPNKYAEARALVEQFPELAPWTPERRFFYDNEPRNTVLFEALSLAVQLLPDHDGTLA